MPASLERPPDCVPVVVDGPVGVVTRTWQLRPPQDSLVVIAKATFAIDDMRALDAPVPSGDDFAPFKPKADVVLTGNAHAQKGKRGVTNVQLALGDMRVSLAAIGPRTWDGGAPSAPAAFDVIPLTWEHAFGGQGFDANPVGVGADGKGLPNLERPDALIKSKKDRPAPHCFAPIPQTWEARWSKLGSYDESWQRERWPYFPKDFDWAHFNVALPEQQIAYPRGDERFDLAGVHPERAVISGKLPGVTARALALTQDDALREIALNLDTVAFDAERLEVALVWRGLIDVSSTRAPELMRLFVCLDELDTPRSVGDLEERLRARLAPELVEIAKEKAPRPPRSPVVERDTALALIASEPTLAGFSFSGCDLQDADLSGKTLTGAHFEDALLGGAKLDGADLQGAVFVGARAPGASFRGANLAQANLSEAVLADAVLDEADLSAATLADADLDGASLRSAVLRHAKLDDANLRRAKLDDADVAEASLSGATLEETSFRGAILTNVRLYDCAAQQCCFDGATLSGLRADGSDLTRATFIDAKAPGIVMESVCLTGARFDGADLSGAILNHADLSNASLDRILARQATFRCANLAQAHARSADLMEADFEEADLSSVDFSGASLYGAEVWKATLSGIKLEGALIANTKLTT